MTKKYLQYIFFGFFGLLFSVSPAYSYYSGYTNYRDFFVSPALPGKPSSAGSSARCYCLVFRAGYATVEECDCTFTYKVIGLKTPIDISDNNGGHNHDFDTHPVIEPPNGELQPYPPNAAEWLGKWYVKGHSLYNPLRVIHPLPEVSGNIEREIIITAPPGWGCDWKCWTPDSWRYLDTIHVGIEELAPLEDSGDYHVVGRGDTDRHPEGTYGTVDAIYKIKFIAYEYFARTDRKLSINDLSLPKGGLFDYKNTWAAPHREHRTGTDADINRTDGGGVFKNCWEDNDLKDAIKRVAKGQSKSRLKCEDAQGRPVPPDDHTGIYKHIDFD